MRLTLGFLLAIDLLAQTYRVQTPSGIVELASEAYVAGVVAGESGDFRSDEALKAMAVAARSYAARTQGRHSKEGFDFCSTTHCQRFVKSSARSMKAALGTTGQIVWFNGKPAFAAYSRRCGGETENVTAVWPDIEAPYLVSHTDPYCYRNWTWSGSPEQIRGALLASGLAVPDHLRTITIVRHTNSGRAQRCHSMVNSFPPRRCALPLAALSPGTHSEVRITQLKTPGTKYSSEVQAKATE